MDVVLLRVDTFSARAFLAHQTPVRSPRCLVKSQCLWAPSTDLYVHVYIYEGSFEEECRVI